MGTASVDTCYPFTSRQLGNHRDDETVADGPAKSTFRFVLSKNGLTHS
jgi:hypothetical protein